MPFSLVTALLLLQVSQPVTVGGRIVDPSGGAIAGASIALDMVGHAPTITTSDGDGRFTLTAPAAGRGVLTVTSEGFTAARLEVSTEGSPPMTIRLQVAGVVESVAVSAEAYRPRTSATGTKLDLPPLEAAESVTTIPQALIQDRNMVRLSELAGHVAGVRPLTGYTGTLSNNYTIRGFTPSLSYTTLRNGFPEYSFLTQRDVANIDRVEFVKGPASLLYGANEVGGIVNTITKRPLAVRRHEIGLVVGNDGYVRPTLDLTGPIDSGGRVRYRLNAAHDRGNSYRDLINHENTFVAPALLWSITPRTELSVELERGWFDNDFDRGFVTAPEFLEEDFSKNYAEPWASARNRQTNTMLNITHRLNGRWRVRAGFNYIRNNTDTNAAGFAFIPLAPDGRTINRNNFFTHEVARNYNSQNELYGDFRTGSMSHQMVAGLEAAYYQFKYTFDFKSLAPIDRINPVHGAQPGFPLFGFNDDSFSQSYATFIQDQMTIGRFHLLLGVRASFLSSTARDYVYFSFTNSFQPNFAGRSRSGEQFDPTRGRQFEVGVKQNLLSDRVLVTLAYYELTKRGVLVPDPEDPSFTFSIQIGEQKSRGFEGEVSGSITPQWKVIATYSGLDAFISRDSREAYVGQQLAAAARHSGSVYTRYLLDSGPLAGFAVGGGVFVVGERFAQLPNPSWAVPGYARIDADFGYQFDRWRLNVAIKNVSDERYFETGGFGSFMPQAPRHALASLHVTF
jgi:iron complex outermembrane receptor protein